MIYDSIENIQTYCDEGDAIFKAVVFVCEFDFDQPDGKYEVDGQDIVAAVQSTKTAPAEEKMFEAHQEYIDVQMVVDGEERHDIVLLDCEKLDVAQDYDEEKDLIFFKEPKHYSSIIMKPGMFAVYGPEDVHRPCCNVDESKDVRRVCVKIKIDAMAGEEE